GNGAQGNQVLDGLVGWTIFADANGVMGEYVRYRNFHQRAESYRASTVITENQEPRAKRAQLGQCEAVENRAHCMFSNPEVQIAACTAVRLKIAGTGERQTRFCRRSQIGGTSDHPRKIRCDGIEDFGGRVAPGDSLAIGRKSGNIFRPFSRKLSLLNLI